MIPNVLTIAGSDPSGGAGIQADLKTFAACDVYGCAVIAGLTAQNTRGVTAVLEVAPEFVVAQLETLFDDVEVHAVKTGMLGSSALINAVAGLLSRRPMLRWVVDPVMVAKGGHRLLPNEAVEALRTRILPHALLVTPNLPEAAALLGAAEVTDVTAMMAAARALQALGPRAVLVKGGHLRGAESSDVYFDGDRLEVLVSPRVDTVNTHGTGCTLSAAITAGLGRGLELFDAVVAGKRFLDGALLNSGGLRVGGGHGPVHHGWRGLG